MRLLIADIASNVYTASVFAVCSLLYGLVILHPVAGQAIDNDKIDFTKMSGWNDLRRCVKCIMWDCGNLLRGVGCETNACLCRPSTLGEAVKKASDEVLSYCSNFDDQSTATSILTSYCSAKGYTGIQSPVLVTSTGASTVTVTTAASVRTIRATTTILSSDASTKVLASPRIGLEFGVALIALALLSVWWTCTVHT